MTTVASRAESRSNLRGKRTMAGTTTSPDEELLARFAGGGDAAAFAALVDRHWARALRIAARVLGDPAAAEDVAQEAFLKLASQAARFEPGRSFGGFFYVLVLNCARDAGRRRADRRRLEAAAGRRLGLERGGAGGRPPGEAALLAAEVDAHVRDLPDDLREALVLTYWAGLPQREVAEAVGCPPGTVASRLRRGLERLRTTLGATGAVLSAAALETVLAREAGAAPVPEPPGDLVARALAARGDAPAAAPAAPAAPAARRSPAGPRSLPALLAVAAAVGLALFASVELVAPPRPPPPAVVVREERARRPTTTFASVPGSSGENRETARPDDPPDAGRAGAAGPSRHADRGPGPGAARPDGAAPAASVGAIRVAGADGAPVEGAEVTVGAFGVRASPRLQYISSHLSGPRAKTDASGLAPLPAERPVYGYAIARRGDLAGRTGPTVLGLAGAPPIPVVVRPLESPAPGTGSLVLAFRIGEAPAADREALVSAERAGAPGSGGTGGVRTDAAGTVELRDIPPGEYAITATIEGAVGPGSSPHLTVRVPAGAVVRRTVALRAEARIAGLVRSRHGEPLPGVTVCAHPAAGHDAGRDDTATTDAGGRYEIAGLPPGLSYHVYVRDDARPGEREREAVDLDVPAPGLVDGPTFTVEPPHVLTLRVVDRTGRPIPRASVAVVRREDASATRTDGAGRLLERVAAGACRISIRVPGAPDVGLDVEVPESATTVDLGDVVVDLELPPPPPVVRVTGRVLAEDGSPVEGAAVVVEGTGDATVSGEGGRFALDLGTAGAPETVVARTADGRVSGGVAIDPRAADRGPVDLVLQTLRTVRGRVDGAALPRSAGVRLERIGPGASGAIEAPRGLGPDGTFEVQAVRPGRFRLDVLVTPLDDSPRALPLASAEVLVAADRDPEPLALGLPPLGGVLVRPGAGAPAEAVALALRPRGEFDFDVLRKSTESWTTDPREALLLVAVPAGVATVALIAPRGDRGVLRRHVTVPAGEPVDLALEWPAGPAGAIAGHVAGGRGAVLALGEAFFASGETGRDGSFRIDGLPPGRYRLLAGAGVKGDGRLGFDPSLGAFDVTVRAGETAAAGDASGPSPEEALFADTVAIAIEIPLHGDVPEGLPAYEIADAAEVRAIVGAVRLEPQPPAGWKWPNTVRFRLRDGREIRASLHPEILGVRFPGGKSADYALPGRLRALLVPHLRRAVEHYRRLAPDAEPVPYATGESDAE